MSETVFNSICPDSAQNNDRLCFTDGHCADGHGTGRADAELKTASVRTVPRTMTGYALQTGIVLTVMVLEGQMRNLKRRITNEQSI